MELGTPTERSHYQNVENYMQIAVIQFREMKNHSGLNVAMNCTVIPVMLMKEALGVRDIFAG